MRMCTGFWVGIGAGLMAGAGSGNDDALRQGSHENAGGKEYPQAGCRRGHAVDSIVSRKRLTRRAGEPRLSAFFDKIVFGA